MNKLKIKEYYISYWFENRKLAAINEYKEVITNTPYSHYSVMYNGNIFNPLNLKSWEIKGIHEVQGNSIFADKLDRYIRIIDDQFKVTRILTVILNKCNSNSDFEFIVFNKGKPTTEGIESFKEVIEDDLRYLKRIQLMAEMV